MSLGSGLYKITVVDLRIDLNHKNTYNGGSLVVDIINIVVES